MPHHLKPILEALQADPAIIQLASGMTIPLIGNRYKIVNSFFHPFPPAFIPIFEDNGGPSLSGILHHWFVQRDTVYVKYLIDAGIFVEVGRNGQQVIAAMLLQMDMVEEGITPVISTFANALGYKDLAAIDAFAETYGDIPSSFHHLEIIGEDVPLSFAPDLQSYKGDFPASERLFNQSALACSFEVPAIWGQPDNVNRQQLFDQYLAQQESGKAWLTLNSSGWLIADAIKALIKLKELETNPLFHLIADNWISGWQAAHRTHLTY